MKYRSDRNGNALSQLGFGCMRLPRKGTAIDLDKAEKEILLAVSRGVNYFDTAYLYPGSEECLGRILEKNGLRDKVFIATKLPQYLVHSAAAIDRYFEEELRRLRTDHVDYYLMHMFTDITEWEKLRGLGIETWIAERKKEGRIANIGFSYHGDTAMFQKILNAYDWDFCQIQYNYLDEHSQAGRAGLEAAAAKGIPVIIMEPLRGGKLVNLPEEAAKLVQSEDCGSAAALGLRWLWDQPAVTCVLSGMNSEEMVEENTRIAEEAAPGCLTDRERALIGDIRAIILARVKVGCTGCRYCMPCPKGVDIPGIFHYYNMMYAGKKLSARLEFAQVMGMRREPCFATRCVGCGKCEAHCPQKLPIREMLKKADRELRAFPFGTGIEIARKFMIR